MYNLRERNTWAKWHEVIFFLLFKLTQPCSYSTSIIIMNQVHLRYFIHLVYFMANRNVLLAMIPWYHTGLIHQYCQVYLHLLVPLYIDEWIRMANEHTLNNLFICFLSNCHSDSNKLFFCSTVGVTWNGLMVGNHFSKYRHLLCQQWILRWAWCLKCQHLVQQVES